MRYCSTCGQAFPHARSRGALKDQHRHVVGLRRRAGVGVHCANDRADQRLSLGAGLLASPWLLGFSTAIIAMWNAVIIGALVVGFTGWALAQMQSPRQLAR